MQKDATRISSSAYFGQTDTVKPNQSTFLQLWPRNLDITKASTSSKKSSEF